MQERWRSWSVVRDLTSCRVQASFHAPSIALEWAASISIFCNGWKHWVHKKCSGLKRLTKDPDYRCTRCQGTACPLDGRPQREVQVGPDRLEVVTSFFYLGDMLSAAGEQPQYVWKPLGRSSRSCYQLSLPATSLSRHVAVCTGLVCNAPCQWDLVIDKAKPPMSAVRWQGNDQTDVQCQDIVTIRSNQLLSRLGIVDLELILKEKALLVWTCERSNVAVKTYRLMESGRPKIWKQLTEGLQKWNLSAIDPFDRHTWKSGVRFAMRAASQVPVRGPTGVDVAPVPTR